MAILGYPIVGCPLLGLRAWPTQTSDLLILLGPPVRPKRPGTCPRRFPVVQPAQMAISWPYHGLISWHFTTFPLCSPLIILHPGRSRCCTCSLELSSWPVFPPTAAANMQRTKPGTKKWRLRYAEIIKSRTDGPKWTCHHLYQVASLSWSWSVN